MKVRDRLRGAAKDFTRRRIICTIVLAAVATLLMAPDIASNAYHSAIAAHVPESQAEGRAFLSVCLALAGCLVIAGVLLLEYVLFLLPMLRDIASGYQWLRVNLPKVKQWPGKMRAAIGGAVDSARRFFASIRGGITNARTAASKADPGAIVFFVVSLSVMAVLMYFGWPIAGRLAEKLPQFLADDGLRVRLFIDFFGSGLVFSIVMPLLGIFLVPILKRWKREAK